jgi:hypothetical protein
MALRFSPRLACGSPGSLREFVTTARLRLAWFRFARLRLAALGLVGILALTLFGSRAWSQDHPDHPWRQGYVLKGDLKIEGKIQDRGDRIVIKEKNGIELEFAPGEVSRPVYTDDDDSTAKKRMYEVKKLDGTVLRGLGEEREGTIVLRPIANDGKELPEITIKLGDTEYATPVEEGATDVELDRIADADGHFVLERPSPDWKIRHSASPTVRAQMVLTDGDKDVTFAVGARPLMAASPAYLEVTKENARKLQSDVQADLGKELEKVGNLGIDVSDLFGTPVYEVHYEGSYFGEQTNYQFLELRFLHDGMLFCLTGFSESKFFKDFIPRVREAFTGFSYLPSVGADDDSYIDLVQGFAVDRPSPRWRGDPRPFDSDHPITYRNEDGRAFVRVQLTDAGGRSAASFVDSVLKENGTKAGFAQTGRSPTTRGGIPLETYRCEFFGDTSTQKRDFQGLVAVLGNRILHVIGEATITDPDSKQLQKEVQSSLERLRLLEPESCRQRLANGTAALSLLALGIDAQKRKAPQDAVTNYTKAIEAYPDYARAYFLRAMANEELKQWKACREDLAKASQLDPRREVANRAAGVFLKEAQDRARDKEFLEACKAWKEVLRADPKNPGYRKDIIKFYSDWWNDAKKCPAAKVKDAVEEIERNRWTDRDFNHTMAEMFADAADIVLKDNKKNADRARALANRALGYDKNDTKAQDILKQTSKHGK